MLERGEGISSRHLCTGENTGAPRGKRLTQDYQQPSGQVRTR